MRSVRIDGEGIQAVQSFLSRNYAAKYSKTWETKELFLGLFIHEEFVLRTSSYQTLTTTIELDKITGRCIVKVIGSGGGGGIFNISWGSQEAGENTIISKIKKLAREVS